MTAYPLLFHLLDTAVVVQELWDRFLASNQRAVIAAGLGVSEVEARVAVAFWAGLHDLGKLTPGFQQCVAEAYAGLSKVLRDDVGEVDNMRHDRASMHSALGPLSDLGYAADANRDPGVRVAQILGGHHGRFQPMDLGRLQALAKAGVDDGLGGRRWRQLRKDYIGAVNAVLGVPVVPRQVTAPSAVLITGLVILADWLVSQEHYWRPWAGGAVIGAAEHFSRACAAAPGLVADAGLVRVELSRKGFAQVHGIERPNPLQASIMEELPGAVGAGILVVTAATGDGKTETALEAERILAQAAGTSGLCFVLPTMATSDEMYKRVAAVVAAQVPQEADDPVAVTLTHSMAWLNEAYSDEDLAAAGDDVVSDEQSALGGGRGEGVRGTLPGRWLRGAKRPLLAQFAVGTIDQSLLGVLPVKHNALRLLALSGKTFVVDEAHAYEPYMQVLLCRLLQWLGSYRCPVVLLSATLPSSVGERLVRAYLEGTKRVPSSKLQRMSFRPPYPGWLFVDADGNPTAISKKRQEEQSAERQYRLRVDVRRVRHLPAPADGGALPDDARLAVLEGVLSPLVVAGSGCAAVVCTTVADAQETYAFLKRRFALKPGEEIVLLHARFPGDQRERTTRTVVQALGRTGRRPDRMVVVASQVIEQSLDLDADLVVSDLAPVAQLLQRAGRCWRHEQAWVRSGKPLERPAWTAGVPRLVVLDPLGKDRVPPKHWGTVYPHYLLSATSDCLHALGDHGPDHDGEPGQPQHRWIDIPEDVQVLVEEVHGTESRFEAETATLQAKLTEHQADTMAQQHIGEWAAIPGPRNVGGLHDLHRETLDEVEAATRLGAESVRMLGCYRHPDGRMTLDPQGAQPLPQPTAGRFSAKDVRAVMRRTLPVRAGLFKERAQEQDAPTPWREQPLLGDLLLLVHPVVDGQVEGVRIGSGIFRLDPELGLVHLRD